MAGKLFLYDSADLLWKDLCDEWEKTQAQLVLPSEVRKTRFLLSRSQSTLFGNRVMTVQDFWNMISKADQRSEVLSNVELRTWIEKKLEDDDPHLAPLQGLAGSQGAVDSLAEHLLTIDLICHDDYAPHSEIEKAIEYLRQIMPGKTREGARHIYAKNALSKRFTQPIIFAPLGIPSPSLADAMENMAEKGNNVSVYFLTNPAEESYLFERSSFDLDHFEIHRRYAKDSFAGQLFSGRVEKATGKTRHIETDNDIDTAFEIVQRLIQDGAKAKDIGLVIDKPFLHARHIAEAARIRAIPVLLRQKVLARDTPVTSFLLSLCELDVVDDMAFQGFLQVHAGFLDISADDLSEFRKAQMKGKNLRALCEIYKLGKVLASRQEEGHRLKDAAALAHAYLDSLHRALSAFQVLEIEPRSLSQVLEETESISLLRGDIDGVVVLSYPEAVSYHLETGIFCQLNSEVYPPEISTSAFVSQDLLAQLPLLRPEGYISEFVGAVASAKNRVFIRSVFDRAGAKSHPSPFWEETRRLCTDDIEVFSENHYQESRRVLRRTARNGQIIAKNIEEALLHTAREKLPTGFFQGTRTRYSVTELERFLECPYGWFVQYVLRPQSPQDDLSAKQGEAVHDILADVFTYPQHKRLDALKDAWIDHPNIHELFNKTQEKVYLERVRGMIKKYGSSSWPYNEQKLEVDLAGNILQNFPKITITGRADRIDHDDKELLVIDYKNRRALKKPAKSEKVKTLQNTLYPALAKEKMGLDPLGMIYISIFHNDHAGILSRKVDFLDNAKVSYDMFEDELAKAILAASEAIEKIQSGEVTETGLTCPPWCSHHILSTTGGRFAL